MHNDSMQTVDYRFHGKVKALHWIAIHEGNSTIALFSHPFPFNFAHSC